jgi:hypothetical protein
MATIMPEGENLRKAVKFVSEGIQHEPEKTVQALIEAACLRFNLSPKEESYLVRFFSEQKQ